MFIPLEYKIKKGDTLSEIAQKFGTNIDYLTKINKIKDADKIQAGKELKLYNFEDKGPIPIPRKVSRPIDLSQYGTQIDPNTGIPVGADLPNFISPVSQQMAQPQLQPQPQLQQPNINTSQIGKKIGVGGMAVGVNLPNFSPPVVNNPYQAMTQDLIYKPPINEKTNLPRQDKSVVQTLPYKTQDYPIAMQPLKDDSIKEIKQIQAELPNLGLAALNNIKNEKKLKKDIKNNNTLIPINVRQFFNPNENRTEDDLSKVEKDTLRQVIINSQTPERIAEKKAAGLDPDLVEYVDYQSGSQYDDVSYLGLEGLSNKIKNPFYNLKTFLGQFKATKNKDGKYNIRDIFDFKPKTKETGLNKLKSYIQSVPEIGGNMYGQLRNVMGYFGPQEGTGEGGKINITI